MTKDLIKILENPKSQIFLLRAPLRYNKKDIYLEKSNNKNDQVLLVNELPQSYQEQLVNNLQIVLKQNKKLKIVKKKIQKVYQVKSNKKIKKLQQ